MAFFKEPLHNTNDITVMDTKFTTGDINIEFHRFDSRRLSDFPIEIRPANSNDIIHDIVVYKDAIHIFGCYGSSTDSSNRNHYHLAYNDGAVEWLNNIPYPFIHSKAIVAKNELYLIGLSGGHGQDTVYGNIMKYDDSRDAFSLYKNIDKSFEYADAVVEIDDYFHTPTLYICGGLGEPTGQYVDHLNGYISTGGPNLPGSFNNLYTHMVSFNGKFHAFVYDEDNNITKHYWHNIGSMAGESFTQLNSFTIDKITNVIVLYGNLLAFTYHSGIYIWDESNDTWTLLDDTVTQTAYFYPKSVILYKNKVHVFCWAPNAGPDRKSHSELSSLYTMSLGDTQ